MSIAKPFTFTANTYAKASEVNADFDTVYAQVNSNISAIAQNATDIDNLENNKANINGDTTERFAVADPVTNGDAINKQTLMKAIGNSIDYISGLVITKDSGSPNDTIIVSAGSCYDSTKKVVLSLSDSISKQNLNQGASATYYVYIIGNATGSSTDILISSSSTTPTLPSGYTLFRQIGYFTTNSNSNIDSISYYGNNATSNKNPLTLSMVPDWSNKVSKTVSTTYVAETNGWVYALTSTSAGGVSTAQISVNGTLVSSCQVPGGGYTYCSASASVAKGDTYSAGGSLSAIYFVPVKGGN